MRDKRKEKVFYYFLNQKGLKNQEVRRKKTVMATRIAITISFVVIIL